MVTPVGVSHSEASVLPNRLVVNSVDERDVLPELRHSTQEQVCCQSSCYRMEAGCVLVGLVATIESIALALTTTDSGLRFFAVLCGTIGAGAMVYGLSRRCQRAWAHLSPPPSTPNTPSRRIVSPVIHMRSPSRVHNSRPLSTTYYAYEQVHSDE